MTRRGNYNRSSHVFLLFTVLIFGFIQIQLYYRATKTTSTTTTKSHEQEVPSLITSQPRQPTIPVTSAGQLVSSETSSGLKDSKIVYVGEFGLGHRLSKLSGAYHLARLYNLTLETHWGYCTTSDETNTNNNARVEIFRHLFGTNLLFKSRKQTKSSDSPQKTVLVRNDVVGYFAGQMFKNSHTPITKSLLDSWCHKFDSDLDLFRLLISRFRFADLVHRFQQQHKWDDFHVIGLHLRAGNGEQEHFVEAQRGVKNTQMFVQQVTSLLDQYIHHKSTRSIITKPVAVFLATDTSSMIEMVQTELSRLNLPLWISPSHLPNEGVSYTITRGDDCLEGWKDSWIDEILLASSNTLVAGMRSTFTQILPRAMVQVNDNREGEGTYCEVDVPRMTCFRDASSWLFRNSKNTHNYCGASSTTTSLPTTISLDPNRDDSPVIHKVLVHLPEDGTRDVHEQLRQFLQNESADVLVYGERFASKYRKYKFEADWTWL